MHKIKKMDPEMMSWSETKDNKMNCEDNGQSSLDCRLVYLDMQKNNK